MSLPKPALTPLLCIFILPALAQTIPPAPTLEVYSRETIVDVTVTDAKGSPVHGLTQSDFAVKEDNKPQSIRSFEEFGSTTPTTPKPFPKLPPNVYTNLQPPPASSALNILLLDFVNTAPVLAADCCRIIPCPYPPMGRKPPDGPTDQQCSSPGAGPQEVGRAIAAQRRVKLDAMNYLQHLPAGTRVEVIGMWWPGTLRVLQGVTSDPALLSAAVDTMNYDTNSTVGSGGTRDLQDQFCAQADGRDRMTLEVLQQIATDLIGIKGRKNLIWFTVGTPYITDPSTRPGCLPDYSIGLTRADSLLLAAQVALYPVDARGIMTMPDDLLELSGKLALNISTMPPAPHSEAMEDYVYKVSSEQLSLEDWAERTGGAAFYNTNDLAGALAKAIDKGSNYYTLSYIPPGANFDGRYHKIKIEVTHPGLHLTYRNGYAAEDPSTFKPAPGLTLAATLPETTSTDPAAQMQLAMGRAMPASTGILFDVQVEPSTIPPNPADSPILGTLDPSLKDKPLTRYAFQYAIPARQIAFASGPNGTHNASLELDLAVYDADSKLVTGLSQTVKMPLSDAKYQQLIQGPFRFFQQLDLPSGPLFLRIGILDRASGKIGTLEIPLTVPRK
jgi:VWFA-related protein